MIKRRVHGDPPPLRTIQHDTIQIPRTDTQARTHTHARTTKTIRTSKQHTNTKTREPPLNWYCIKLVKRCREEPDRPFRLLYDRIDDVRVRNKNAPKKVYMNSFALLHLVPCSLPVFFSSRFSPLSRHHKNSQCGEPASHSTFAQRNIKIENIKTVTDCIRTWAESSNPRKQNNLSSPETALTRRGSDRSTSLSLSPPRPLKLCKLIRT